MEKQRLILLLLVAGLVSQSGCGDEIIDHTTSDGGLADQSLIDMLTQDQTQGSLDLHILSDSTLPDSSLSASLTILVKGDLTPSIFNDGFSGQTPTLFTMGLARFELIRSIDDTDPVTIFDHGQNPVPIDMLQTTLAGEARLQDLPAGSFSHGRVLLTSSTFTVAATVHAMGVPIAGEVTVTAALSDTIIDNQPFTQGQANFNFKSGMINQTIPGALPPFPSTAGGNVVQKNGQTWMTFPFPEPLVLSPSAPDHLATISYKVFESFRWQEQALAAYQHGIFDIDLASFSYEPVVNFGATGYDVTIGQKEVTLQQ